MSMEKEKYKKQLEAEGFKHIYEWTDASNTEYKEHSHKDKVSFFLTDGDLTMTIGGKTHVIKSGERMDVPVGVAHSAKVGANGCTFIVGEMIEGDS